MQDLNLSKYKLSGKYSILQFMAVLGIGALLATLLLSYFYF